METLERRILAAEKRLRRAQSNPAPTVPNYEMGASTPPDMDTDILVKAIGLAIVPAVGAPSLTCQVLLDHSGNPGWDAIHAENTSSVPCNDSSAFGSTWTDIWETPFGTDTPIPGTAFIFDDPVVFGLDIRYWIYLKVDRSYGGSPTSSPAWQINASFGTGTGYNGSVGMGVDPQPANGGRNNKLSGLTVYTSNYILAAGDRFGLGLLKTDDTIYCIDSPASASPRSFQLGGFALVDPFAFDIAMPVIFPDGTGW